MTRNTLNLEVWWSNLSLSAVNEETLPSVTVLIAARPDQAEIKAVTAARDLDYPKEKLEILVARGKQPSVQRNAAIHAARGELIYFLDDDSVPPPGNLRKAVGAFVDANVKMLGGPNICPPDAPFLEQVFALVHASWLAFFSSRARYASVGKMRESSEKELILCNLIARREPVLKLGGFDESLYPNEENALMDDLQKGGGRLMYDPHLIVYRRPRHSLKAFCRMLLNYGRGRAEQFKLHPTLGSAPNFVPPLFVIYLILEIATWFISPTIGALGLVPLTLYGITLIAQSLALIPLGGVSKSICSIPLIFLTHVLYGFGFLRALVTPVKSAAAKPKVDVVLQTIQL
jgi:succinoglycan biosynthesis protein ExoA